jgi:hypothetical protein
MRKLVFAAVALALSAGLALAGEVKFVAYDKEKKELKVKDGTAEKVYKLTDKTVFKNGDKEVKEANRAKAMERFEKMKPDTKFELTADKEAVTEVKFVAAKKDKDK